MKTLIPILSFMFIVSALNGQCDDLFISEYVEGYANNKALEIYNPTNEAINLSEYSVARASNGSTVPASNQVISLPDVMLEPNDVFVVVVDLRDTSLWDSQFDKPAWNGYNLIDTLFDAVTGEPITDSDGNVIFGPQYTSDGSALFGTEYNEEYDLQCKADAFLCPEYQENNAMYFNGNDAVILLNGEEISPNGDNIVDVIGVIGEDPEDTIMEDAWVDMDGFWLTKNRTLVRKPEVQSGRNVLEDIVFSLGGTFSGEEWVSYRSNTFDYLGIHNSNCHSEVTPDRYSCSQGPLSSVYGPAVVDFKLYPNPAYTGNVEIEAATGIRQIEIFNIVGQKMWHESYNSSIKSTSINTTQFEKGMYLIRISWEDSKWSSTKLIIE